MKFAMITITFPGFAFFSHPDSITITLTISGFPTTNSIKTWIIHW